MREALNFLLVCFGDDFPVFDFVSKESSIEITG